jgi:ubiquitin-conjugating enzyme E2 D/E
MALKYVTRCLLRMQKSPPSFYTFAPIEDGNLCELLGSFLGPIESPYENGIFHVRMQLSNNFPMEPPQCWFITKVYHPNIDEKGAICLDILTANIWSPALSLEPLLVSICSLLDSPDTNDPLMPDIVRQLIADRAAFEYTAREWTTKYATGEIVYPGTKEDGISNTTLAPSGEPKRELVP